MVYTVEVSGAFVGDPAEVYSVLADYRRGHPSILPRRYFSDLEVLAGGYGDDTRIRFRMNVMGVTRQVWAVVAEPDPGRVLTETDLLSDTVTVFRVSGQNGIVEVTIASRLKGRPGLRGKIERFMTRRFLRKVYVAELEALAAAVCARPTPSRANAGVELGENAWRSPLVPSALGAGVVDHQR